MVVIPLIGSALHKKENDYQIKFGHTIGRIHHIAIVRRIDIFYTSCRLVTQTMAPKFPGFEGLNRCIYYLDTQPHKPIFYPYNYYEGYNVTIITWIVYQVEAYNTQNYLQCHQDVYHARNLNRKLSISVIIHTLLGVAVLWKVQIQSYVAYAYTDGEICFVYKYAKKNKDVCR